MLFRSVVSDSWKIAQYLEEQYPEAKLFPGLGMKEACRFFNMYIDNTLHPALVPVVLYDVFEKIEPVDRDYFRENREARFGATLEDIRSEERRVGQARRSRCKLLFQAAPGLIRRPPWKCR